MDLPSQRRYVNHSVRFELRGGVVKSIYMTGQHTNGFTLGT